jgi:hypothetical protein
MSCLSGGLFKIAANGTWLCAVGDFGNGTFNLPPKLNSISNAQLTTSAPIAQNQCCAYVAVNLG